MMQNRTLNQVQSNLEQRPEPEITIPILGNYY